MGACQSTETAGHDPYKIPPPEHHYPPGPSPSPSPSTQSSDHPLPSPSPDSEIAVLPKSRPKSPVASVTEKSISPAPSEEDSIHRHEDFFSTYKKGKELGVGSFAIVFIGMDKKSGKEYAIKQIDRKKMQWGERDALEDEIANLVLLKGAPNIMQLYYVYQEPDYCFLVTELLEGGELFDRILEKRTFTEKEARDVCRSMLNALNYMHQRRVAHRDLKPENLLLKSKASDTDLTIADFGFAKKLTTDNGCRTLCGTPGYLAPEILERWPAYDTKCDLWSLGVILFLLLGGYLPFDHEDEDEIFELTRNGEYTFYPHLWNQVSRPAKNLVVTLLTVNPSQRASAELALKHEWMLVNDEALARRKLSVVSLQQSILAKKGKASIQTVLTMDRLQKLNDDFESYLMKRNDSTSVFTVAAKALQHPVERKVEDSATGLGFEHFYEAGDLLGEGGFGVVRRAEHTKTHGSFAVKIVDRTALVEGGEQALQDEIAALKILRGGPHIVRLFDVFKEKRFTYLVMEEMVGGELLQRIVDKVVYTERDARSVCKILFSATDYCHKKRIAHRDLKPENLLLSDKNDDASIKIADFGFARKVSRPNCLTTLCGTASYVAPEVLDLTSKGYDERVDIWSIGVIMYILLGGYAPFEGPVEELANVILRGDYKFHKKYWQYTSTDATDLIRSCLQVNPNLRITAEEALQSDWMSVEGETLSGNDLSEAQDQIRNTLLKVKLKGAVHMVMLANKFTSLGNSFTSTLGDAETIQDRQQNRINSTPALLEISFVAEGAYSEFNELYELGITLGSGSFTVVREGVHRQSKQDFAIKCVDRRNLHPGDAVALQDEITALKMAKDCPHIVHLYDVFEEPDTSYLVLERMHGGELIERIIKRAHYTEADAKAVCKNILLGLQFCHRKKIANRNLKPENLLLMSEENDVDVKICDFAYAKKVLFPNSLRTQCGTEGYVAPEILEHKPAYDVHCDIWSLGVVLYILLGGYRPFRGTGAEVMRCIRYGEYEFHERYWNDISAEAKDLVRQMMTVDPNKRISAADALKSTWILANDGMLQHDLSDNKQELKSFKAKAKLRQVVQMMIALNKLQSLGKHYRKFEDF